MEPLNIFYSWQSDSDKRNNHFFIRDALRTAIENIQGNPDDDLELRMDSDTQNIPGSPDIAQAIFNKIDNCIIFVADVSIINPDDKEHRKTPNPNVLIELGYAIHRLGWERIVCVFNENTGNLESDLPFDIKTKRITKYKYPNDKNKQDAQSSLSKQLKDAISLIINSELPIPITNISETEKLKRMRDLKTLKNLLSCVNLSAFDYSFDLAERGFFNFDLDYYWIDFDANFRSANYHIYNPALDERITAFYKSWMLFMDSFSTYLSSDGQQEGKARFLVKDEESEIGFKKFREYAFTLNSDIKELTSYIKNNYIEIDLIETSATAKKRYLDSHQNPNS